MRSNCSLDVGSFGDAWHAKPRTYACMIESRRALLHSVVRCWSRAANEVLLSGIKLPVFTPFKPATLES